METIVGDTKAFMNMRADVWYSLMLMKEEEMVELYGKFLSSWELQILRYIVKEMIYTDVNLIDRMTYLNFKLLEIIAALAVNSSDFEKKYLRGYSISYTDFYNLSYQVAADFMGINTHKDFLLAIGREFDTVSLERLVQAHVGMEVECSISEWEFCSMLETMPRKEIVQILELFEIDRETKRKLGTYVIEKKTEIFVDTISSLSPIEYGVTATLTRIWYDIVNFKKIIIDLLEDPEDIIRINKILCSIVENRHIHIEDRVARMFYLQNDQFKVNSDYSESLNFDYHFLYQKMAQWYAILIYYHNQLLAFNVDIEVVEQVRKYISIWKYARDLEKSILEEKIDPFDYIDDVKSFEIFKDRFITELIIPQSIGNKKNASEYFCCASGKKELKEEECRKLYKVLVDEGLLKRDENIYFSFMYRMCPNYTPQRNNPSPIIWKGKPRELFNLIWNYYEGTTKIWDKTKKFFLNSANNPLKINGIKNMAVKPTVRMKKIFDIIK